MNILDLIFDKLNKIDEDISSLKSSPTGKPDTSADEVGGIDFACKVTGLKQSTIYQLNFQKKILCWDDKAKDPFP